MFSGAENTLMKPPLYSLKARHQFFLHNFTKGDPARFLADRT